MSDQIRMALIIGAAIVIATGVWIYFSPYQTCVRALVAERAELNAIDPNDSKLLSGAEISCAHVQ